MPSVAQDYKKCVMIETKQGETLEYYISSHPRLTQDNEKVMLTSDLSTIEFATENIKKVYVSEGSYKLTYMLDGSSYKTYYHHAGVSLNPEPVPAKEGYKFLGWENEPSVMPSEDVLVLGSYSIMTSKLIYQVDGVDYKSFELDYGSPITPIAEPVREGYSFSGWSDIPQKMPANDVTITGTFKVNKYHLTYNVDGKEYKSMDVEFGTQITPLPVPQKEGYVFSGWGEIPATMPAQDVVITGSFSKGHFQLNYMVDGQIYKSINYEFGETISPEPDPEKTGYTFSGWSQIPSVMPAEDVEVRGSFIANKYTLTYKVGGEVYKTYEIEYGTAPVVEEEPQKEGYTFSGWSYIPSKMPAENVTVIGNFKLNEYTITYVVDGNVLTTNRVGFGMKIVPPNAPEREGYDFTWDEYPETMPSRDLTIEGRYTLSSGIDNTLLYRGLNNAVKDYICLKGLQPGENVEIYNIAGEKMMHYQATPQGNLTISLLSFSQGVYIIKTRNQTFKITRK